MSMKRIQLKGTELNVSPICLGTWQFNDGQGNINWQAQSEQESKAIVDKSFELGINFFDTAEGYAGSEAVLGKCLQGRRQDAVVATKFGFREGPFTPAYTPEQIDQTITKALTKLQTSYIDLLQIHFPSFVTDPAEAIAEFNRQISLGRIRYYGFSNYGAKNIKEFMAAGGKPVTNQIGYNLFWRSPEHGMIPESIKHDISVLAYSPLQQGLLTGKFATVQEAPEGRRRGKLFSKDSTSLARHGQDGAEEEMNEALKKMSEICKKANVQMSKAALAWILQQEGVDVVIVGARTPEQMVENSEVISLSNEVVEQLRQATEPVKTKIGLHLDQWATPDRCE